MSGMKLSRSGGPESLPWIVKVPDVQIADLRTFWCGDSKHRLGRDFHGDSCTRSAQVVGDEGLGCLRDFVVEFTVSVEW